MFVGVRVFHRPGIRHHSQQLNNLSHLSAQLCRCHRVRGKARIVVSGIVNSVEVPTLLYLKFTAFYLRALTSTSAKLEADV